MFKEAFIYKFVQVLLLSLHFPLCDICSSVYFIFHGSVTENVSSQTVCLEIVSKLHYIGL